MQSTPQLTRELQAPPISPSQYELTRFPLVISGLPNNFPPLRVVQISDLHRRGAKYDGLIQRAISHANSFDPDIVLITGDFVDHSKKDVLPVVKLLGGLKAHKGIYAVLGNHDHRGDPVLLQSALEAAGIAVLTNSALEPVDGLWLIGVDDILEGNGNLELAMSQAPNDAPAILMSHNPNALNRVSADRPLTILSGHTHGGQIRVPFPPPGFVCRFHLHTSYVHGWYTKGAARMYVNRGIGNTGWSWVARRINCLPEITCFDLTAAH